MNLGEIATKYRRQSAELELRENLQASAQGPFNPLTQSRPAQDAWTRQIPLSMRDILNP